MADRPLGRTQRQVLLLLMDGGERSAGRVALDLMTDYRDAYAALTRLWRRSLVDRVYAYNRLEWHLTRAGSQLAAELFPDGEDPDE